jgi:hypothetical protein
MKSFYWISFTKWSSYKFMSFENGYLMAKRVYIKGWRWTPIIKVKYHKYTY